MFTKRVSRREVALKRFPHCSPRNAVRRMTYIIKTDPYVRKLLFNSGYMPGSRYFSPKIANLIEEYV